MPDIKKTLEEQYRKHSEHISKQQQTIQSLTEENAKLKARVAELEAELCHEKKFHCYFMEGDSVTQGAVNAMQSAYNNALDKLAHSEKVVQVLAEDTVTMLNSYNEVHGKPHRFKVGDIINAANEQVDKQEVK